MEAIVQKFADRLVEQGAQSVFLYGSRARGDATKSSDWELGVIYNEDTSGIRAKLAKLTPVGTVSYPFVRAAIEKGDPDVPFTKSIWLNEVIRAGKTLAGEAIIEVLSPPKITKADIQNDVFFYKARAFDAMLALRAGNSNLAKDFLLRHARAA